MRALNVVTWACFAALVCLGSLAVFVRLAWIDVPWWLSGIFRLDGGHCSDAGCEPWYAMNIWGKALFGVFVGEIAFRIALDLIPKASDRTKGLVK